MFKWEVAESLCPVCGCLAYYGQCQNPACSHDKRAWEMKTQSGTKPDAPKQEEEP